MILALNLDISWFTTIPGMLITGGVLLLIIALIIFIATSGKKDPKNEKVEAVQKEATLAASQAAKEVVAQETPVVVTPAGSSEVISQPVITPTVEETPISVQTPEMDEPSVFTNPIPTTVAPEVPQPVEVVPVNIAQEVIPVTENRVDPVESPVEMTPVVPTTPVEEAPVMGPVIPVTPVSQDTIMMPEVKIVEPTPVEVAPVVNITPAISQEIPVAPSGVEPVMPVQQETPTIYGGVSPVIPTIDMNPQPERTIYGGANPLENTQSVPIVMPTQEVTQPVVEPVQTPVPAASQDAFISATPVEMPAAPRKVETVPTMPVENQAPVVTPTVSFSQTQTVQSPQPSAPTSVETQQPESLF